MTPATLCFFTRALLLQVGQRKLRAAYLDENNIAARPAVGGGYVGWQASYCGA